jgi:hypothetical protein
MNINHSYINLHKSTVKVVLKRKKSIKSINLRFTATDYPFKFLQINFMFNLRDTEGVICIILSLLKTVDGHNHLNIQLIYVDLYNCGLYSLFCSCDLIDFLRFNTTFNNISAISWRPVLVVEEAGENHRPCASNW